MAKGLWAYWLRASGPRANGQFSEIGVGRKILGFCQREAGAVVGIRLAGPRAHGQDACRDQNVCQINSHAVEKSMPRHTQKQAPFWGISNMAK